MNRYGTGLAGAVVLAAILGAATLGATPARAEVLTFHAALDGKSGAEPTGSTATATALIEVDTASQRVSVDMAVAGITIEQLWDRLVASPAGPVHLHKYASAGGGDAVLVLPLPFGANYRPSPAGMSVRMKGYHYGAGARLLNSTLSFDQFVSALRSGLVVLNVHTQAYNPGEISGRVMEGAGVKVSGTGAQPSARSAP